MLIVINGARKQKNRVIAFAALIVRVRNLQSVTDGKNYIESLRVELGLLLAVG